MFNCNSRMFLSVAVVALVVVQLVVLVVAGGEPPAYSPTVDDTTVPVVAEVDEGVDAYERYVNTGDMDALSLAATHNHPDALFLLAQHNLLHADFSPHSLHNAYLLFHSLASIHANGTAQFMLAFFHSTGIINSTVPIDQAKAALYYSFGAANGDRSALKAAANRHHIGISTQKDCDAAVAFYALAAEASISLYLAGPPGGLPPPKSKLSLADDVGGVYGPGASKVAAEVGATTAEDILQYYQYAANKGDVMAQLMAGEVAYTGTPTIQRDYALAYSYFRQAASRLPAGGSGSGKMVKHNTAIQAAAQAAGMLGRMYWRGDFVQQDNATALKWFARSAAHGNAIGYNGLGEMYLHGTVVKKNTDKAFKFFQKSAELDFPDAYINLGIIHFDREEYEHSFKYFSLAAKHGRVLSYYYLAEMHNFGLGVQKSCHVAAAYYKNVAERDYGVDLISSAYHDYKEGKLNSAFIKYLMAAEQGYETAQANVAFILDRHDSNPPIGLSKNMSDFLALVYWNRAANQGNVDARVKMGDYVYEGRGTVADPHKAAGYYQVAEQSQSSIAMFNLGYMHENGIGLEQDFHLAKRYYDRAYEANQEALFPVTLALAHLHVKYFFHWLVHGGSFWLDPPAHEEETIWSWLGLSKQRPSQKRKRVRKEDRAKEPSLEETILGDVHPDQRDRLNAQDEPVTAEVHYSVEHGAQGPPGHGHPEAEIQEDPVETVVILVLLGIAIYLMWGRQPPPPPQHQPPQAHQPPQTRPPQPSSPVPDANTEEQTVSTSPSSSSVEEQEGQEPVQKDVQEVIPDVELSTASSVTTTQAQVRRPYDAGRDKENGDNQEQQ